MIIKLYDKYNYNTCLLCDFCKKDTHSEHLIKVQKVNCYKSIIVFNEINDTKYWKNTKKSWYLLTYQTCERFKWTCGSNNDQWEQLNKCKTIMITITMLTLWMLTVWLVIGACPNLNPDFVATVKMIASQFEIYDT